MRRLLFVLTAALGACASLDRPARRYDAATFFDTLRVAAAGFSADESRVLLSSDQGTGTLNVWSVPATGGEAQRLTESPGSAWTAVSYFPRDDRVLFTADQGGNELHHLYVRELDGRVVDLTPGDKLKAQFLGWRADLGAFFVATNERDARYFDVYRCDPPPVAAATGKSGDYARTRVFENAVGFDLGPLSRDGRWLVLHQTHHNANDDLHLVDLASPQAPLAHLTPHEGDVTHEPQGFAPDGSAFYYTSDAGGEFARVWRRELVTGATTPAFAADWDVQVYRHSWDGRHLVIHVNADARTQVTVLDTSTGQPIALPLADVEAVQLSRSGRKAILTVGSDVAPPDLYCWDLGSNKTVRLTRSLDPKVDAADLVASTVVRYPSFDGLQVPALLYRPKGASQSTPAPAVVWVHGGPGGQTRQGYRAEIQFLVNHGYAVLGVNNRGSSGYGRTFFHLDDRRHGEDDLKDCIWGRRYLETLDWVDGKRVAIMGGSYGGYIVCAALTLEPTAFEAGIDIFGVTNWLRTLTSIPAWWEAQRKGLYAEMGDPATDEARLRRISPLFQAKNIVRPLLVVQGANDPRVLKVESDEIVAAARANGVEVEYLVFDDEGHGFRRRPNRIAAAEAYVRFLDAHLRQRP